VREDRIENLQIQSNNDFIEVDDTTINWQEMDLIWTTNSTEIKNVQQINVANLLSIPQGHVTLKNPSSCSSLLSDTTSKVLKATNTTNAIAEPSQFVWKASSNFIVTWDVLPDYIVINLNAATNGWVSFGVSAMGQMSSGDFCTGWIHDKTGQISLFDTWSPNKDIPYLDTNHGGTSDCILVSGKQEGGRTSITYKRRLTQTTNTITHLWTVTNTLLGQQLHLMEIQRLTTRSIIEMVMEG